MTPEQFGSIVKDHDRYVHGLMGGRRADLKFADLSGMRLPKINLQSAMLTGADLSDAILDEADFRFTDMFCVNLERCVSPNAQFFRADLRGADAHEAKLRGADLREAELTQADLSSANLGGANLVRATLREADLSGADLSHAILDQAKLRRAHLTPMPLKDRRGDETGRSWPTALAGRSHATPRSTPWRRACGRRRRGASRFTPPAD